LAASFGGAKPQDVGCRRKIEMSPGVQSRDDTPGGSDEVEPRI
jgi:hypothetical protein